MPADAQAALSSPAIKLPPGPRGQPVVGVLPKFFSDWLGFLTRCRREYGDVVFFRIGPTPVCLLSHPDDIETVLVRNHQNFHKSRDYRALGRMIGDGLLTSEGEHWRRQRRLAQPAFHHERIAGYAEIMTRLAERQMADWKDGEIRDIHREMMRLTLRVVAKALFGADVSGEEAGVGAAMEVLMRRFMGQAQITFLLPKWLPVPSSRRLAGAARHLDEVVYAMIRERRAYRTRTRDLLDMLLHARDADGAAMSDRQLRDELITLFLAGHETTALALTYTWYLLGKHPEVEARLAAELDAALGGRPPTADDLPRLRYAEMVIQESMRLYPPAWGVGREALAPFQVGEYRLPAGTNVFICQWIVHRDARFFPEPERFDPERWRQDPLRDGRLPRFAYFPFGGGPRVCIGASFAMMEAVLLLSSIAQKFRLELVTDAPLELLPTVTLRPRHEIPARLIHR